MVERVEQPDGQRPAAERDQVDRQEALGHAFAHADEDHHREHADRAALQSEKPEYSGCLGV